MRSPFWGMDLYMVRSQSQAASPRVGAHAVTVMPNVSLSFPHMQSLPQIWGTVPSGINPPFSLPVSYEIQAWETAEHPVLFLIETVPLFSSVRPRLRGQSLNRITSHQCTALFKGL